MSRKISGSRNSRLAVTQKTAKAKSAKSALKSITKGANKVSAQKPPARGAARPSKKPASPRTAQSAEAESSADQILARAEAEITSAIDSLNNHMNAAMSRLTDLATAHYDRGKAIVRTAPLDRATAMFQRLVAEVVDDQLADMLPPLIALRMEMAQHNSEERTKNSPDEDFERRGIETLDHVLALASVQPYEARIGETLDPLIHLAVGEIHRDDLADGAIGKLLQPGFRSARGKVIAPAKVLVNRK